MKKSKRMAVFHVNKFQRIFFYPVIIAFFIGIVVSWLNLIYFLIGDYLSSPGLYLFQRFIPSLLAVATVLMVMLVFWVFRITSRYFGAYERIIDELDDALAKGKKGPLKAREGDFVFMELLKRINALIEKTQ